VLVHQDRRRPRPTAFRIPPHLAHAQNLTRREAEAGDEVGILDAAEFGVPDVPADADWLDLGDDWRCTLVGAFDPRRHLRTAPDTPRLLPIDDGRGRTWHAPAVLTPRSGDVALNLAFGQDEQQVWKRVPTPAQAKLIAAARAARAEIDANRLGQVPFAVAVEWALAGFEAVYHLPTAAFAKHGWITDRLLQLQLLAMAGLPLPTGA
jgi:hypothetical protein